MSQNLGIGSLDSQIKLKLMIEAVKAHDYVAFLEDQKVYYQNKYLDKGFITDANVLFFKKLKLFIDEEIAREKEFIDGVFNELCPHSGTNGETKVLFKVTKRW